MKSSFWNGLRGVSKRNLVFYCIVYLYGKDWRERMGSLEYILGKRVDLR